MFYINGSYLTHEHAKISVLDLGIVRGYGVFDYLRTYKGKPFHFWDHLLRLKFSANSIGLTLPKSLREIQEITLQLLKRCNYNESSIKIIITGGPSPDQMTPQECPSLIIHVYPMKVYPEHCYTQGIKTTTTMLWRPIPMSKTLQYTPAIMALKHAQANDAQEALFLNAKKEILEATTSNFFIFKNGTLITSSSEDVLVGITREVIFKIAGNHYPIEIRPIAYDDIVNFDEAFVCSSNKEVMPVIQIDEHPIKNAKVGKNTQKFMQLFKEYTEKDDWGPLEIERYRQGANSSVEK